MKEQGKLFGSILALVIVLIIAIVGSVRDDGRVAAWCKEHNCEIRSSEKPWFDNGPFWFVDDETETVYRVRVWDNEKDRERIAYFRVSTFSLEQAWKDE